MQPLARQEQTLIARIDPPGMLAQVLRWSELNSGTDNLPGLAAQAELLAAAFAALPGELRLEPPAEVETVLPDGRTAPRAFGSHLVLSVRPDAPRRFLLTGHMDTVFPADHPFQTCSLTGGETLVGPGVADMKGGIAVMLAALTAFEGDAAALQCGYDVVINSDEEAGSPSSAALIARLAQGKEAALTFEPATSPDGTLAGARGGSGNFSVVVTGRAAHAGRNPQDGRNAVVAAAALTLGLKALERDGLNVNPARIDGGAANNAVPDTAVLRFNVRPRDGPDQDFVVMKISRLVADISVDYDVTMQVHGGMSRPPKPLDRQSLRLFELVRRCGTALGQQIAWAPSGGVCDGNNIAACGVPTVDTLGVRGGAIHSADEYLIVPSLGERAALSALVLLRLAGGELR